MSTDTTTSTNASIADQQNLLCSGCKRLFRSIAGLKNHQRACKSIVKDLRPAIEKQYEDENSDAVFKKTIHDAYTKMSVWRRNLFQLPKGTIGKSFNNELNHMMDLWNNKSPYRDIALKMFMLLPSLLLQRTNPKCSTLENRKTLEKRLGLWRQRNISSLLTECLVIQSRLSMKNGSSKTERNIGEEFQKLMIKGNVNGALRLLTSDQCNGILPLNDDTMEELHLKHPEASPIHADLLLEGPKVNVNDVIYEGIDDTCILKACVRTKGAAGVSGWDADESRRVLGSNIFGTAASDLRKAIASLTKILCTERVTDPDSLEPFLACRLIPLDKNPGLRPIGIGEVIDELLVKLSLCALGKT